MRKFYIIGAGNETLAIQAVKEALNDATVECVCVSSLDDVPDDVGKENIVFIQNNLRKPMKPIEIHMVETQIPKSLQ